YMLKHLRSDRVGQKRGEAEHELALRDVLDDDLVSHVRYRTRSSISLIALDDIPVQKYAFPGYENIVEHDHGIHFLEPRSQRMIEMSPAVVDALAADETQSEGIVGNAESKRVGRVFLRAFEHG